MMDENNYKRTWRVIITMVVITSILIFGGLYILANPDATTKTVVIMLISIAVVIGLSLGMSIILNNDKDN